MKNDRIVTPNNCDICGLPIQVAQEKVTSDHDGKVLNFCSDMCYKRFLKDPELYTDHEDEEVLE